MAVDSRALGNLRRKRQYAHKQLDRLEPAVARLKESLAETKTKIAAVAPELNLPPRRYKPNPNFARGELPRLFREIVREADLALSMAEIARRVLALKGFPSAGAWSDEADPDARRAVVRGVG